MFPTKILLATDGSEEAGRAARMATTLSENLAEKLGEEVQKISVMGGEVAESYARISRPDAEIVRLAEETGPVLVCPPPRSET